MIYQIELNNLADCEKFVNITSQINGRIEIFSLEEPNSCYSGKSLLGVVAAAKQDDIRVVSDSDISEKIKDFILPKGNRK